MTWYLIAVSLAVVALVVFVWRRQNRHPVAPGKPHDEIEKHHGGWGNPHSGSIM